MAREYPTPADYANLIDRLRTYFVQLFHQRPETIHAKTWEHLQELKVELIPVLRRMPTKAQIRVALEEARAILKGEK